jgi:internalin A
METIDANAELARVRTSYWRLRCLIILLVLFGNGAWALFCLFTGYGATTGEDLGKQIGAIKSGYSKSIVIRYCRGTNMYLRQLANVPGIENIILDTTDATDRGMKSLTTIKTLKSLRIIGGSVGDEGFSHIATIPSIEHLELTNTHVSDRSISGLKGLPKLQWLSIGCAPMTYPGFTDAGLDGLRALTKLKTLYLSCGFASHGTVEALRKALPDCVINESSPPEADE